jgi:hypothetical protein
LRHNKVVKLLSKATISKRHKGARNSRNSNLISSSPKASSKVSSSNRKVSPSPSSKRVVLMMVLTTIFLFRPRLM